MRFVAAYRGACPERSVVSGHRSEVIVPASTIAASCRRESFWGKCARETFHRSPSPGEGRMRVVGAEKWVALRTETTTTQGPAAAALL